MGLGIVDDGAGNFLTPSPFLSSGVSACCYLLSPSFSSTYSVMVFFIVFF